MRSLGLSWLRQFDRHLVVPEVVYVETPITPDGHECSGMYYHPKHIYFEIDGNVYDMRFGALVIGTKEPELIPGIIAHEWRHHWQWHNGWKYDGVGAGWDDYEKAIRRYFTQSRCEADALAFEHKHAKGWLNEYFMDLSHGGGAA